MQQHSTTMEKKVIYFLINLKLLIEAFININILHSFAIKPIINRFTVRQTIVEENQQVTVKSSYKVFLCNGKTYMGNFVLGINFPLSVYVKIHSFQNFFLSLLQAKIVIFRFPIAGITDFARIKKNKPIFFK